MARPFVSIVVPAFEEEGNIEALAIRVRASMENQPVDMNCSSSTTAATTPLGSASAPPRCATSTSAACAWSAISATKAPCLPASANAAATL